MSESHDIGMSTAVLMIALVLLARGGHLVKAIHNGWDAGGYHTPTPTVEARP